MTKREMVSGVSGRIPHTNKYILRLSQREWKEEVVFVPTVLFSLWLS